jgi:hypothetical protein
MARDKAKKKKTTKECVKRKGGKNSTTSLHWRRV